MSQYIAGFGISAKPTSKVRAYIMDAPAPSTDELLAIIVPLVKHAIAELEKPTVEITSEVVKQIIQVMYSLPETDKLEVSKGIRNAASFIYNNTKYKISEFMHGGSAASTGTAVYNEIVSGSGTSWNLDNTPNSRTLQLYANGQRLTIDVDYTLNLTAITTMSSWEAGSLLADYLYV